MDVIRLNPSNFQPDELVEGYSSMIWAERFTPAGDFRMVTSLVNETRELIPEGSLISLRDSSEVMIVETHEINNEEESGPVLTVTGRSFETFLENRVMIGGLQAFPKSDGWKTLTEYTLAQAAALVIWNHVVDVSPVVTGINEGAETYVGNPDDILAMTRVTNSADPDGMTVAKRWLELGTVYQNVLDLLYEGHLGIRCVRPLSDSDNVIMFDSDGIPTQFPFSGITQLVFDIYKGFDLSSEVVFFDQLGEMENLTSLSSIKDYKNMAYIDSPLGPGQALAAGTIGDETDLNRRVLYLEISDVPDGVTYLDYLPRLEQRGRKELAKHNRKVLLGCKVSPVAPYQYGEEYNLGDLVKVRTKYGSQTMRVEEYIRTEDLEGERGFPTLVMPS